MSITATELQPISLAEGVPADGVSIPFEYIPGLGRLRQAAPRLRDPDEQARSGTPLVPL